MSKVSLLAAFAVGYVAGARAGRERYDEIVAVVRRLVGDPAGGDERLRDEHGRFVSAKSSK